MSRTLLRTNGWLAHQPVAVQDAVLGLGREQSFDVGEMVFSVGDPPGGCYAVLKGQIAVSISESPAGPKIAHLAQPGLWYGEGAFLSRSARIIGLQAVVPSVLFHLPLVAMDRLAAEDPEWIRRFSQMLLINTNLALRAVDDLLIADPSRRVAAVLIRCIGDGAPVGTIRLSQTELGQLSNVSRKLVNRCLGDFERKAWLQRGYNRIEVNDAPALARYAQE
ncbi:Crp/Fnr family transcriptional regulator [Sulfitobacter sp. D35]|uniref:Crp/Fnr family transcriptional regulator n=1 Tax=Sulfitobacter sp. D35 TaxID=3083252 RepID=UPI00296F8B93|nr:Crp/Fnr family transcriptional regulator [Sulfitobacter sp. D35]MDW4497422.1 Crp/Fnr family transcriptional regulator [Sulfitobacter sp. D35]